MTLTEVQEKAQKMGITLNNKGKIELIHEIQQKEGYTPCFGQSQRKCLHTDCCWKQDCLETNLIPALFIFEVIA